VPDDVPEAFQSFLVAGSKRRSKGRGYELNAIKGFSDEFIKVKLKYMPFSAAGKARGYSFPVCDGFFFIVGVRLQRPFGFVG
jgi:hypothetical protein